jgi:hypothetical protein
MTIHKVQGLTLDAVFIDQLTGAGSQPASAYVVLLKQILITSTVKALSIEYYD